MSRTLTETGNAFTDLTAMALGLALLAVGTVAAIGGTGLTMWVFGL